MSFTTYATAVAGSILTAAFWNQQVRDNGTVVKTSTDDGGNLAPAARTTLTLATDACTPTQNNHAVDTEAAAATDNLSTLTIAGSIRAGHLLILSAANVAHVVTVKDGVGNLSLMGGDCVLGSTKSFLLLQLVSTTWFEIARSAVAPTLPATTLLYSASGTDANAAATDFATIALASGLTQKDSLRVVMRLNSQTQPTAAPSVRNATDPVTISTATAGLATNVGKVYVFEIFCDPFATTRVMAHRYESDAGDALVTTSFITRSTFTTAWPGAWALAMRHGGVTAGGTLYWSVDVYKITGQ